MPHTPSTVEVSAPAPPSLKRRAVRGTLLSIANVGGVQVLRLAGNLITTRLLFPEAYGLMLLVLVVSQGLQMVSDIGIVPSIVQHERGEERSFLSTAWTMQLARGALVTLLALLIAWPYAQFYGRTELFPLIAIASVQGVISGLDSTKLATCNRRIDVGRLVFVDIVAQAVTFVVMVGWALASPTVWALLAGALAGDVTRTLLSHLALPGQRDRLGWDRDAARVIFGFGKWIFLSTLVTYLGWRFDSIALGKLVSLEELGVYGIGQNLASLPVLVTGQAIAWVLLPALSESFRDDRAGFFERFRRVRRALDALGVLMTAGTAIGAPAFFYLLYDPRYHAAGWMVQLLMLPTWFFFLSETAVRVPLAMGDSRAQMLANVAKLAGTIPGALGGYFAGAALFDAGLAGLLVGLTFGSFVGYVTVAWILRAKGLPIFARDMGWTLRGAALALAGGGLPYLVAPLVGLEPALVSLVIGPLVILPYAAWCARLVRAELR